MGATQSLRFLSKATFHGAGSAAGVPGEGVKGQQETLHGERGAAVEAAQRGPVQPQEIPHIRGHPFPVPQEFGFLLQPQHLAQMTLPEGSEVRLCWTDPLVGTRAEQAFWNFHRITGEQPPPYRLLTSRGLWGKTFNLVQKPPPKIDFGINVDTVAQST